MITQTGPNAQHTPAGIQAAQAKPRSALTSDFETFLKMLTAQARNQDPLEPLDSTEYAAQLAQFSMVEQQVQTNDLLAGLAAAFGGPDIGKLAKWVGVEVLTVAPTHFDGAPITVLPAPATTAEAAYLVVHDQTGGTVARFAIPVSSEPVVWPGRDGTGAAYPSGPYSFSVESYKAGAQISKDPAATYNRVTEAQIRDGEVFLTLASGQTLDAASVTAIRAGS